MTVWRLNKITGISYLATRLMEMSYIFLFNSERISVNPNDNANQYFYLHENHIEVVILSIKLYDIQNWKWNSYFLQRFFLFFITTHVFMNKHFCLRKLHKLSFLLFVLLIVLKYEIKGIF